ncbi:hypothetical protein [Mariniluteicoccus endophyticus]
MSALDRQGGPLIVGLDQRLRRATGDRASILFSVNAVLRVWPAFDEYARRAGHRMPVFALEEQRNHG